VFKQSVMFVKPSLFLTDLGENTMQNKRSAFEQSDFKNIFIKGCYFLC